MKCSPSIKALRPLKVRNWRNSHSSAIWGISAAERGQKGISIAESFPPLKRSGILHVRMSVKCVSFARIIVVQDSGTYVWLCSASHVHLEGAPIPISRHACCETFRNTLILLAEDASHCSPSFAGTADSGCGWFVTVGALTV